MSSKKKTSGTKSESASALVPKLRFPEFRNGPDWRVKKLNELLFETKTRNRSLELGPADVLSVSGEHGCVNQIEYMGRSYAGVTVKDYHVVEHGDLVYTKSPLKKNPFGIIKENKGKRGIVSTLYAVYRPFLDCSATYLDHFFSRDYNLNAYLQPIVKKGAKNDMKVNNADVLKGNICVPALPEQQKIASCLSSLDNLISSQARKVELLKKYKKGLLQQLFPREGETEPRLRFPEFRGTGAWENLALGERADILTGFPFDGVDISQDKNGVRLLRGINIAEGRIRHNADIDRYYTGSTIGLEKFRLRTNDLVIGMDGSKVGKNSALISESESESLLVQRVARLRAKPNALIRFIFHRIHAPTFHAYVDRVNTSSGIPHISAKQIQEYRISFPAEAEQKRIADLLGFIDDGVAAHERKLETLKTHKKGLMQGLFPVAEGVV
ncbi:MAG TPA: restriction endonuclease subunit S [Bacteroidetes bacterium]|nr:restriction endonuclease subunit S [Bacteroidota bacterium]